MSATDKLPTWPELTGGKTVRAHYAEDIDVSYQRARADAAMARLKVAVTWIKEHARHDEINGKCYGLKRPRVAGDPPGMVYEEHKCRCGLDALLEAIGPLPEEST